MRRRPPLRYTGSPALAGTIGARLAWTALMISALSIPFQVDRGDTQVRVAELALDDVQGNAFVGHLQLAPDTRTLALARSRASRL